MATEKINFGTDAILVGRVSTQEQVLVEDASPQIDDLIRWAKKNGYKRFHVINSVESGFLEKDQKKGWNLVEDWIEKHPSYRTIIVTSIDRLARSKKILGYIQQYLEDNKVQLIVKDIQDGFKYLDEYGKVGIGCELLFSLYISLATSEMRIKKERFKRALHDYRQRGYSIGGKELFGYTRFVDGKLNKKSTYRINDKESAQVIQVFNWYAYGIENDLTQTSASKIAIKCKAEGFEKYLHSKRNVQKLLKEEAYTGHKTTKNKRKNPEFFNYGNQEAPKYVECESYICTYPVIINRELFDFVQKRLEQENTQKSIENGIMCDKSTKHTNILSKILKCGNCGCSFISEYRYKDGLPKFAYRCGGGKVTKALRKCDKPQTISMKMIDSAMWAFAKAMVSTITSLQNREVSENKIAEINEKIARLEEGFEDFNTKRKVAEAIFQRNANPHNYSVCFENYNSSIDEIEKEENKIQKEISKYKRELEYINIAIKSIDIEEKIKQDISMIESNKEEISKYMHLLIKDAIPICNKLHYLVLQIVALTNIEEVFNFGSNDSNGLPKIKSEKKDGIYYLIIKKDFHCNYEVRAINDNLCNWNSTNETFYIGSKEEEQYTPEDIFNIDTTKTDPSKFCSLTSSVVPLEFKLLDVYSNDLKKE